MSGPGTGLPGLFPLPRLESMQQRPGRARNEAQTVHVARVEDHDRQALTIAFGLVDIGHVHLDDHGAFRVGPILAQAVQRGSGPVLQMSRRRQLSDTVHLVAGKSVALIRQRPQHPRRARNPVLGDREEQGRVISVRSEPQWAEI